MNLTLAQALARAHSAGLARLDARMLLLHLLGRSPHDRAWLIAHDDAPLDATLSARWDELIAQRLAGIPVAYLTGRKAFYGLELRVDAHTLDPREDTETLVDWALALLPPDQPAHPARQHLRTEQPIEQSASLQIRQPAHLPAPAVAAQARAHASSTRPPTPSPAQQPVRVLDLGTGCGAIALAIARQRPHARVTATDASPGALAIARANGAQLNLPVRWLQGEWHDWFAPFTPPAPPAAPSTPDAPGERFDLIVSNPPYIAETDPHLPALTHEPHTALVSGADGLADIRRIIAGAGAHLAPGGWLLLEHGHDQSLAVRTLLAQAGYAAVQSRRDLAGIERCSGGRWTGTA